MRNKAHDFEPFPGDRSPDSCVHCGKVKNHYLHGLRAFIAQVIRTHEYRDGKMSER